MIQTILTAKQSELLENLIARHGQVVTASQVFDEAGRYWDYKQAKNMITRLVKNGWLIRIKRGMYAISDLASRGYLTLSPYVVANLLVSESYVSFESALQHYGMFDQMTRKIVSVALKMYKSTVLNQVEYRFVTTQPRYYFGWQDVRVGEQTARIATPEKALIDIVHYHRSQYAIDLVIEKLTEHRGDLDFTRLDEYLSRCSLTTMKIFGLIFDLLGINSDRLYGIAKTTGTHWMIPGDKKFNARWRLYYDPYFDKYQTG